MAYYFFDVFEDGGAARTDSHGEQFETLELAKREACHAAGAIAAERFNEQSHGIVEVAVRDEYGAILARARVAFGCD